MATKKKIYVCRLLPKVGPHQEGGTTYTEGMEVRSTENLAKKHRYKFKLVRVEEANAEQPVENIAPSAPAQQALSRAVQREGDDETDEESTADEDQTMHLTEQGVPAGKNVTSQFPMPDGVDVLIFREGRNYFVSRPVPPYQPLNEAPLERKQVRNFLSEMSEEVTEE